MIVIEISGSWDFELPNGQNLMSSKVIYNPRKEPKRPSEVARFHRSLVLSL